MTNTESVLNFLQNPNNNVVDLFQKLTTPVSMELYDAVCYRDNNRSTYDDEVTLNSRTLMEFLQLSMAIYNNKIGVRVDDDAAIPTSMTTTPSAAISTKITQLENMVRRVNDNSRFKSKLQNILERIINENNFNNLSALFKTFLDLYKLYQVEESDIDQLFREIVTLDRPAAAKIIAPGAVATDVVETVSSASPSVAAVAKPTLRRLSSMGAEQSYAPPPPPPPPPLPMSASTVASPDDKIENKIDVVETALPPPPPPPPPPMPSSLISIPTLTTPVDQSTTNAFTPPPPPPPPPPPSSQTTPPSLPLSSSSSIQVDKAPVTAPPVIDFSTELKERLKRKTPLSPDKLSTLQHQAKRPATAAAEIVPRSESTLSILQRRVAVEPSSTSSGTEAQDDENDWLASTTEVTALKTQFKNLQKKIEQLPMELPDSITTLTAAISSIFEKTQIMADDADTLRAYLNKLEKLIKDIMTL
ncbi:p78/83 WASP family protein [Spodoptera exigua multiple nucleopolyhedrovirus]|nr:p78/83 WASP family protein [Spodoptera exigua multiple nucleopolyhedrovirus]